MIEIEKPDPAKLAGFVLLKSKPRVKLFYRPFYLAERKGIGKCVKRR
jgi:hypothetical protein